MNESPKQSVEIKLSVISPVFNEEEILPHFLEKIHAALTQFCEKFKFNLNEIELILVNDGSKDSSPIIANQFSQTYAYCKVIHFSRNFGHQSAITAGLEMARGSAVVIIDSDLQDPPEVILNLYETHLNGYDVVYAVRESREGETWFKLTTAKWFYKLLGQLSDITIPQNTGDFRLISRRALVALAQCPEKHRFVRGLISFIGYPQIGIPYRRHARTAGTTKYSLIKMLNLALNGLTSFSTAPLRVIFLTGTGVATSGFVYALWILFQKLILNSTIKGWTSLTIITLVLGGFQLIFIGILGEYVAQIHKEVKNRPSYFIDSITEKS